MPSLISQFRGSHWYGVAKARLVFGPFTGGINKSLDPLFVRPHEMQDCVNYIVKADGRLIARPPVKTYDTPQGLPAGGSFRVIGTGSGGLFRAGTAFNGPIAFDTTGFRTWLYNPLTDTWSLFSNAYPAGVDYAYWSTNYKGIRYTLVLDSLAGLMKLIVHPAMTNVASFTTLATSSIGAGANPDYAYMMNLKDRMVVVSQGINGGTILWSKATDPTTWAAPDGGFAYFDGDSLAGTFILQDSIYIFGSNGIWRFSWQTDPSVDGTLERIGTTPIFGATAYNNEIYVATINGVFKFLNGFLVELSQNIRYDWENRVNALAGASQPGLTLMENFLLAGPFGTNPQFYYVYDLQQQIWTSWQFPSAVSGPLYLSPTPAGTAYSLGVKRWLWHAGYSGALFSIPADGLTGGTVYGGYDTNSAGNKFWMGFKLTTAEIDLGDGVRWKRVFKSLLEAVYTPAVFTVGTSKLNLILDGVLTTLTPPETGLLAWGKSFRAKRVGFQYDSTGVTIGTATTPAVELNNIDRVEIYVRAGEEITQ